MSASVDQRMKGQGSSVPVGLETSMLQKYSTYPDVISELHYSMPTRSNGPKDMVKDEEFEAWRNQPHQAYNPPMSSSSIPEPYLPSYYASMSYPYLNQTLGDAAWSNGDPMTFLGGYGGQVGSGDQHSHYMDGMFGQNSFGGYNQAYNFFPGGGGGDYSTWGNSSMATRKTGHGGYHDDYYRDTTYEQGIDRNALKHMEQSMGGLTLTDHKNDSQFVKDHYGKPSMLPANLIAEHQLVKKFNAGATDTMVLASAPGVAGQPVGPKKPASWATIASQPAKPAPKVKPKAAPSAILSNKHSTPSMDIGTWESKNGSGGGGSGKMGPQASNRSSTSWAAPRGNRNSGSSGNMYNSPPQQQQQQVAISQNSGSGGDNYPQHPVLDALRKDNDYNPKEFDLNPKNVRFFIIKSYSEDDIHRSIKYSIWCSTEHGNKRLDQAYRESEGVGLVYLFFSVNGSGHFCGMAQMVSPVDYNCTSNVWTQDKWKGQFKVKWIYVKDVPNSQLRHIRLENNDNKPVTNSRDAQEVPQDKGKQVLKILHTYHHTTSIFDDFLHYEKRQEEDEHRKTQ